MTQGTISGQRTGTWYWDSPTELREELGSGNSFVAIVTDARAPARRLIAAAPELLDMCEAYVDEHACVPNCGCADMRAVIAKARGKAH